jgi:Ca2+-binding RTX toxin-like protein
MPSIFPSRLSLAAIAVLAAAAALAVPGIASAAYTSTVGADGPVMTGDGASDTLLIDESGGLLRHSRFPADPAFNSAFDFDSTAAGDQTASNAPAQLAINAGAGDDTVTVTVPTVVGSTVHGDDGDDTVTTSNGVDSLFGDGGNDRLIGGRGNDAFAGGAGNDVMVWNNGDNNDTMNGEANTDETEVNGAVAAGDAFTIVPNGDRVRFDRTNLVPFNLDIGSTERLTVNGGSGGDSITGAAGLAPLILLSLNGGPGTDTITGGDGPDDLTGGDGNDALAGAGGDDRIVGDRGDDTMGGDDGDDTLVWNNGDNNDTMDGAAGVDRTEVNGARTAGDAFVTAPNGPRVKFDRTNLVPFTLNIGTVEALQLNTLGGDDTIVNAPGAGALVGINADGGSGNDRVEARDGATTAVRCGDGADSVVADEFAVDFVLADCETVDRTPTLVPDTVGTPVAIRGGTVRVTGRLRRGLAPLRLTCPAAETGGCRGRLTLASAGRVRLGGARVVVVLGSASYSLRAGQRKAVRIRLPSSLKRIARGKRTLKVRASTVSRDAAGNRSEASRRLTLRLPRR